MIEMLQPFAILTASGLLICIGWSALSVQKVISLIRLFLISTLAGVEIAVLLYTVDLFALDFSIGFAFLAPITALLLGLAALMTLWTLGSDDADADGCRRGPSPSKGTSHLGFPHRSETLLVSDTLFGVPALRVSAYFALATFPLLIACYFLA